MVESIYRDLKGAWLWGYVSAVLLLVAWFFHARAQRRMAFMEQQRMGHEKAELQRMLTDAPIKSSREQ